MKPWILNEFITLKEREILKITLLSAGYELSKSLDYPGTGITEGFISIHIERPNQVCLDGNLMVKENVTYKELMSYLNKKIKENENSRRNECEVGNL